MIAATEPEPDATLTPIYPSTEGLHQLLLRRLIAQVLARLAREPLTDHLADLLAAPAGCRTGSGRRTQRVAVAVVALEQLHRPPQDAPTALLASGRHPAQRRIALEELIAQRLEPARARPREIRTERAYPLPPPRAELERFRAALPFSLTRAQESAAAEILADLGGSTPMSRLLQGDVGSGKTVVAALAAVVAAAAQCQTAVMAPTELLAEQHVANFERWLTPLELAGRDAARLANRARARARRSRASRTAARPS